MVNLKINGNLISVEENTTILEACKKLGIKVPTLCYLKDINEIGACRVCVVELKGHDRLVASCNTLVEDGMEVITDSPKVLEARKNNVKLILSQHDDKCPSCVRKNNCTLQSIAKSLNILENDYEKNLTLDNFPKDFPLVRDTNKCIKCMRCINVCDKIQSLGVWDIEGSGSYVNVGVKGGVNIKNSNCSLCGQCITHCPVGALRERDDTDNVISALKNSDKITIIQIAPAVRTAYGEEFGLTPDYATVNRLVGALKKAGANYVFDTAFSADLTIMEEANELLENLPEIKKSGLPMFTSCCPGWVRFVKSEYPEFVSRLSSAKSPQQMFGAITKTYYAEILGVSPEKIYSVSIMPCTSKKYEASVDSLGRDGYKDVDAVLTTREVCRMIRELGIDMNSVEEMEFDSPLGTGSGAGVIFGATGGVMEAALRSAYYFVTGKNPENDIFYKVRGNDGWKEAEYMVGDAKINVAVVHGLKNTRNLLDAIKAGRAKYDFVEVMACPTGCAGGGGQPIHDGEELGFNRGEKLYEIDKNSNIRFSHENNDVLECYKKFLEKPLSHKAHELLHTNQSEWKI